MGEIVSQGEFARRVGVSQPAVSKAIRNGRINALENGKIDFTAEIHNWFANKDTSKVRDNDPNKNYDESSATSSISKAKLAKETYTAKLRQLEYEREAGMMVKKDDVKSSLFRFCKLVRDAIMTIPDRISAEVTSSIMKVLEKELIKNLSKEQINMIISNMDSSEIERIIHRTWDKETRGVLENLKNGPDV